ncbi:SDR family oxidoreductase [Rhizobium sp. P38BS-XIX]|uniref:SDR family NAD(P)-dependent oxidoreductase n=1 Tax=Rhizobium sp. P38BS-XIX TaxID=2726740 RepID=UPI001456F2AF|nr:SDR family oxidoreductase [Rhizobium sp. P38BS-XIX]NLR97432.1 SDR family oxidoreductase [Rhizobium sp. P38BS-XIX]
MDLNLKGRICLVTGASSGIGRAAALALAAKGAQLIATARTAAALQSLSEDVVQAGGPAPHILTGDLSQPDAAMKLAEDAIVFAGRVDVLLNNAGGSRPMEQPNDKAAWDESYQLNFVSPRQLGEELGRTMAENGWGRIINITGVILAKSFNAASPAKAALESWAKAAAGQWGSKGVTVNCIAPGRLNTRQILERLHPTPESRQSFIDANIPAGYFGEPEDAANLIAFLASDRARYINGATIPVDGGTMRLAF